MCMVWLSRKNFVATLPNIHAFIVKNISIHICMDIFKGYKIFEFLNLNFSLEKERIMLSMAFFLRLGLIYSVNDCLVL